MAGANVNANLCNLIETVKANGLESYRYLSKIFIELPKATLLEDIDPLPPCMQKLARDEAVSK